MLSCCFSTRRKEMSEQTRHATPNLLISIHILWLLISSLLHSLSTRLPSPLPPSPHFASPSPFYLPLFFIFDLSPLFLRTSFLQFFSSPLLNSASLIFFFNSIPCRRKNPRGLESRTCSFSSHHRPLPLSKSSRDMSLAETSSAPVRVGLLFHAFCFSSLFVFHHHEISS